MDSEERTAWIALNRLPGLGPLATRRALEHYGDPARVALRVPVAELQRFAARRFEAEQVHEARRGLWRAARDEERRCRRLGIELRVWGRPRYPAALAELVDAPPVLFVRGELPDAVVRVALVGSRRATSYGKARAEALATELVERGVEIVSGGARGIDTAAHLAALEAGGRTVAVLGSGLERPYPRENRPLYDRLATRGAVLSEFPLDHPPSPGQFPRRNRLISGLSAAVVVVEAERRSGSLSTAAHAVEQGREVMAVPGPVGSPRSVGCHRLIQQGAKLAAEADDVLAELSPLYAAALAARPERPTPIDDELAPPRSNADEIEVWQRLDVEKPVHLDELAESVPFGLARLQVALLALQMQRAVELMPGHYYRRCRRRGS